MFDGALHVAVARSTVGRPHVWPMPMHSFRPGDRACGGSNAIRNSKSGGSASRARLGGPESYVKIKGRRTYLYRAVERAKRDDAAAKAFFRRALSRQGGYRIRSRSIVIRPHIA